MNLGLELFQKVHRYSFTCGCVFERWGGLMHSGDLLQYVPDRVYEIDPDDAKVLCDEHKMAVAQVGFERGSAYATAIFSYSPPRLQRALERMRRCRDAGIWPPRD